MAVDIIDGLGSNYRAHVDEHNRLLVAGSITSMPSISVSANTGSESYIFGKSGANYYPLLSTSGTDGGLLRVESSVSVSTGSEVYIKAGSVQTYNPIGIGSINHSHGYGTSSGLSYFIGIPNTISLGNSSGAITIAATGSFVGDWEDVKDFGNIGVFIRSSQPSANSGLKIEWSTDGTAVHDNDAFTIGSQNGRFFTFGPETQYFRINYLNGSTTGSIILQTIYHPTHMKPSSHIINEQINDDADAELVKAVLTAKQPNSSYTNINATTGGNLKVSVEEYATNTVGSFVQLGIGSVRVTSWGLTTPITTTGSYISYGVGSMRLAEVGVTIPVSGIVNQGTTPWVVSGTATVGGSVYTTGSVNIANFAALGSQFVIAAGSMRILSNAGSIPIWIVAGSVQPYNPIGVGSVRVAEIGVTLPVSGTATVAGSIFATGSINISNFAALGSTITGSVNVVGYSAGSIVRQAVGSPSNYINFGVLRNSFMIDNLGSSLVYFMVGSFTITNADAGSVGIVGANSFRAFDWRTQDLSVQGSGITTPQVQFIGIG